MNKVIIMGRLTADPELRQTQSGISSCRFTVAVNRAYKNDKGEYEADFVPCIAWRQTAEFVSRYFSKGKMINILGTLRNNNYQDRQHPDVMHYTMDVIAENVEFCGDSAKNGQQTAQANNYAANSTANASPAQNAIAQAEAAGVPTSAMSYGNLSDFEEILSDGDVPF